MIYFSFTKCKIILRFSRKRRLLQLQEPEQHPTSSKVMRPEFSNNEVQILKERRIPKLVPIMPARSTIIYYFFPRVTARN